MNICFTDKRVLITGASRGIGRGLAKAFACGGAEKVFALASKKPDLDSLAAEVPNIVPIVVNLVDWNATRKALEEIGPVDILINNAGTAIVESFLDVSEKNFDLMFNVNFKSLFNVTQIIAKSMVERKQGGCIISLSSQASEMALWGHSVYGATKAAIDGLTRVLALELGEHNIRVLAVGPTVVMTDMGRKAWEDEKKSKPLLDRIPVHRFAEIDDVVNTVLFLASDKAAMINATTVPIEGGILAT